MYSFCHARERFHQLRLHLCGGIGKKAGSRWYQMPESNRESLPDGMVRFNDLLGILRLCALEMDRFHVPARYRPGVRTVSIRD
jgi:hypothetical protein